MVPSTLIYWWEWWFFFLIKVLQELCALKTSYSCHLNLHPFFSWWHSPVTWPSAIFFSIMAYSCHRIWHERHMMLCHLNPLVKGTHPLWWFESLSLGSCGVCRGLRVRPKTGGDPQYAPPVLGLNPRLSQLCMVFISPPFLFLLLSNPFFWPLPRLWELFERMKGWLWVNSEQYSPD